MGLPMAANLLRAGFDLTVWNRTQERCQPLVDEGQRVVDDSQSIFEHELQPICGLAGGQQRVGRLGGDGRLG